MKKNIILGILLSLSFIMFTACNTTGKSASKFNNSNKLSVEDNNKIEKLIKDCIKAMYSTDIEKNYTDTIDGNIISGIKEYISEQTINESKGSSELPIHYPRYVSANGMTLIDYKISSSDGKEEILTNNIGKIADGYSYYVKVNLFADGVADKDFNQNFVRNETTGIYQKTPNAKVDIADKIKVQAKYDVRVVKEDKEFKILSFTESSAKPITKNRLFVTNNDYIERIPYLNVVDSENEMIKADKGDLKIYNNDKKIIDKFFGKIQKLDSIRMNLLKSNWDKDKDSFSNFMEVVGLKEGRDILLGKDKEYKINFSYDAFPIRFGMERIDSIKNMVTQVHIGYSKNNHLYKVKFTAGVEENDGIVANPNDYNYEYMIWLEKDSVSKMKLVDVYKVSKVDKSTDAMIKK